MNEWTMCCQVRKLATDRTQHFMSLGHVALSSNTIEFKSQTSLLAERAILYIPCTHAVHNVTAQGRSSSLRQHQLRSLSNYWVAFISVPTPACSANAIGWHGNATSYFVVYDMLRTNHAQSMKRGEMHASQNILKFKFVAIFNYTWVILHNEQSTSKRRL